MKFSGLVAKILLKILTIGKRKRNKKALIFSKKEFNEMQERNAELVIEQQKEVRIELEFEKISKEIVSFFYPKDSIDQIPFYEIDESVLNDFTMFCIEKLNFFKDIEIKKAIWKLIRDYLLDLYKKEERNELTIFLDSVEKQVLPK
jgi:hypothetical protein